MTRKVALITGLLLAMIALAVVCAGRHQGAMEKDLSSRSNLALAESGLDDIQVSAESGRDIVLTGVVSSEADLRRAAHLVDGVAGVRRLDNRIQVLAPRAAEGIRLAITENAITLSGAVPDDRTRDDLVVLANQRFPDRSVVNSLQIDASTGPERSREGALLIESLDPRIAPGTLDLESGKLVITGRVANEENRTDYGRFLTDLFAGVQIDNRLTIAAQPALDRVTELQTVEFESSSSRLTAVGRMTLDEIASVLALWPDLQIEISGHTDSTGDPIFNRNLSTERAEAARTYLSRSLSADRFLVVGHGSDRPVASDDTPEGRFANRRIEFRVIEEK